MKTIQWFLLLTRCHFQPLVTFVHSWLEMATRERQKPFHSLHTSDGKQIINSCNQFLIAIQVFIFRSGHFWSQIRNWGKSLTHQSCPQLRTETIGHWSFLRTTMFQSSIGQLIQPMEISQCMPKAQNCHLLLPYGIPPLVMVSWGTSGSFWG